ncbi:hypothetical protein [Paenibacillus sp. y28]|uniref:hypothetical protein n=1 Tax=Paenibacillus sp. y28 TaxID=3129110 RepID=UPI00301727C6
MKTAASGFASLMIMSLILFYLVPSAGSANQTALPETGALEPTSSSAAEPTPPHSDQPVTLDDHIRLWVKEVARTSGFEGWLEAGWTTYPLGPGTHGWVAIFEKDGQELGYFIIHATEIGGFLLGEYGTGSSPLFSEATLNHNVSLYGLHVNKEVQPQKIYMDPLQTVWQLEGTEETHYLDAVTGELLPVSETVSLWRSNQFHTALVPEALGPLASSSAVIQASGSMPPFDPFENTDWMLHKPVVSHELHDIMQAVHHEANVTFTAKLFEHTVLYAFGVSSYQIWSNKAAYVGLSLDTGGVRYIPFSVLQRYGNFFL